MSRAFPSVHNPWPGARNRKKTTERDLCTSIFFSFRMPGYSACQGLPAKVSSEQDMQICAGRLEPWNQKWIKAG